MKLLKLSLILSLLAVSGAAKAGGPSHCQAGCEKSIYAFAWGGTNFGYDFAANVGAVNSQFDFDATGAYGGGLGLYSNFLCGSRFEIEGFQGENDLQTFNGVATNGHYRTSGVFLNFLKEVPIGSCFTGYLGGGVGIMENELDIAGANDVSTDLSRQGIIGLEYNWCEALAFFAQYRVLSIPHTDYTIAGTVIDTESTISHGFNFGARFSF